MDLATGAARSRERPERKPSAERVTFRSVVLGLLTIVGMSLYITYFGRNLIKNYMPVAAVLPFVAWVFVNTGVKLCVPRVPSPGRRC